MPKRVAESKAQQLSAALSESESAKRRRLLVKAVQAPASKCGEPLLLAIQALVRNGCEEVEGHGFPRGVTQLGGAGFSAVPKYAKIWALMEMVEGTTVSAVEQVASHRLVDLLSLRRHKVERIPRSREPHAAPCFHTLGLGRVPESWLITCRFCPEPTQPVDWNHASGVLHFAKSTGSEKYDLLCMRESGVVVPLPQGITIVEDVSPRMWTLSENTTLE